jgi:hypothetical protein
MGCLFSSPAEDKNVANFDDVRKPKEQGIPPPKIEQDQNKFEPFTPPSGHQSRSTSPPEHRQTLEESTAKTEELWQELLIYNFARKLFIFCPALNHIRDGNPR